MTRRNNNPYLIITVAVAFGAIITVAVADDATLRDGVRVAGPVVTLGDIAMLNGSYALELADVPVATFAEGAAELKLTRAAVRDRLTDADVHWGRLTLRGHQAIVITRQIAENPSSVIPVDAAMDDESPSLTEPSADAMANPVAAVIDAAASMNQDDAVTVRAAIARWILTMSGEDEQDLQITWHNESDQAWALSQGNGRFEIEPQTTTKVGRLPLIVRRYEDQTLTHTHRLRVDVLVRRTVFVAQRAIQRGQIVTDADIARETRWLDSLEPTPLIGSTEQVVGQQADRMIRPGHMLRDADITPPQLVKRGQLITIRAISGELVIRTVARASESGHLNQLIEARHPRTRDVYHVRVSGPQEAVMIIDKQPDHVTPNAGEAS